MSDRLNPDDPGHERGPASRPDVEANLQSLRARLDELQNSVETLGTRAGWETQPPPVQPPDAGPNQFAQPPAEPTLPPGYPTPPAGYPAPPLGYSEPPQAYPAPPAAPDAGYYATPPPLFQPPPEGPLVDPYAPAPPAATNGHGDPEVEASEVSARWATVAIVEAGPFADLIELRHFEDDLSALAAVSDVRVRRFGHGRATIEVGMTGPYPLARELFQLNRPMELSDGPEGEVVIEFAPPAAAETQTGVEPQPEPPAESRNEAG